MTATAEFRAAIAASLGHAPEDIEPGRLVRFATSGRRGDTSGWAKLFDDHLGGVYGCFRAGLSAIWTARPREQMLPSEMAAVRSQIAAARASRETEQREAWRKNHERIQHLQRQLVPVKPGDPVYRYLAARLRVSTLAVPACLMLHPAATYAVDGESVGTWPAMFAPLTTNDGRILAWHRTYLTADGQKADVPGPVRKLSPACGLLTGASIRLHSPSAGVLGVAEGVETALGASLSSGLPTVAAYSAGNLKGLLWPAGLRRLVVFADADNAGLQGAEGLRLRAVAAGLACEVLTPSTADADWLDVYASRTKEEAEEVSA